eukprot:SAG11_NODE_812_length_7059_cov_5.203017_3_plen_63_part_00
MKEVGGGAYTGAAEDPVVAESRPELEAVSTADGPIMLPVEVRLFLVPTLPAPNSGSYLFCYL